MFQSKEYFVALLLGLLMAATISRGSALKGLAVLGVGILLGSIGADVQTGISRFTLGRIELFNGISIIIVAMGLFGVSEIISSIAVNTLPAIREKITYRSLLPSKEDTKRSIWPTLRGTAIGSIIGPLPGAGLALAAFFSYAVEKRVSRYPDQFGTGVVEGIAAPEAANNAAAQTAFIPTFALGIPGTATMAIMLGAMMMHGIVPGPQFVREHFDMFWAIVASFWIGNLILLILNIPLIGVWVSLLRIPYALMYPAIICLVCIGVYALQNSVFDLFLLLGFGSVGYLLRVFGFEAAPLLMGFVLGPLLEENFRRAMLLARGNLLTLFSGPINAGMLSAAGLAVGWAIYSRWRASRRHRASLLDTVESV